MFGFSFSEVLLIGVVTLVAVGPQRLPGMLRNFGTWMRKLRKMTTDVRQQTGIDDMLRAEGLHGGLNELRSLMRGGGGIPAPAPMPQRPIDDPYGGIEFDVTQEYPPEGPDAMGALPDDLAADGTTPPPALPGVASPAVTATEPSAPAPSAEPAVASLKS